MHRLTLPTTLPTILLAGLVPQSATAASQTSTSTQPAVDLTSIRTAGFGLTDAPEGLVAAGPDWRARFEPGGVELTPAFGRGASRNWPLTFALEEVHVGTTPVHVVSAPVEPTARDGGVVYDHGPLISEHYELCRDGLEQSFLVTDLPSRTGELVVRGTLATDLVAAGGGTPRADGSLLFARGGDPSRGGVRIGAVTGIDATGRSVAGTLRLDGAVLELVLPPEFVAGAELPILVDPLIGGEFSASASLLDSDQNPDVAFEAQNSTYLVVWEVPFSATDTDIRAQQILADGTLVGPVTTVASGPKVQSRARVASVSASARFVVVYQESDSFLGPWAIWARSFDPFSGTVSAAGILAGAGGSFTNVDPDVAGQDHPILDEVIVVWEKVGSGIVAQLVKVPAGGAPTLVGPQVPVDTNPDASKPSISGSGGEAGVYFVAYQVFFALPAPGDHDLAVAALDDLANVLHTLYYPTPGPNEEDPSIDGDGVTSLAVFEAEPVLGSLNRDIEARRTTWDGSLLQGSTAVNIASQPTEEADPSVAWARAEFVVAWADRVGPFLESEVRAVFIDGETGTQLDPSTHVFGAGFHAGKPSIGAQYAADPQPPGPHFDQALIVYERRDLTLPFTGEVLAQRVEAVGAGGAVVNNGGGCGFGGTNQAVGPVAIGNPTFGMQVTGADPNASAALLNVTLPGVPVPCGTCNFLNPDLIFSAAMVGGTASVPLPIPNNPGYLGATVEMQWAVLPTSSTPCPLFATLGISNRLSLTFGL